MMQDKIMERKREDVVDDILDEALLYDAEYEPIIEAPKSKREIKAVVHKHTGGEIELRNDLLKYLAVIGLAGLSAWWNLASPILYVPAIVFTLCGMSYKVGEWKGQTK